jgi:homoserine kinase
VPQVVAAAFAAGGGLGVHAGAIDAARLVEATRDWLHQSYREPAMPQSYELMKRLRGKGFAAVISGAGPSVLVLGRSEDLQALATEIVPGFSLRLLAVGHGVRVID